MPLTLRTRVLVRELGSGDVLVVPVCDPKLASYGSEDDALLEQRMFLAEHLGRERPETVARFSLPEGTRLHVTDVVLPRDDLPRTLAIATPIGVPSLVIPSAPRGPRAKVDAWVMIVPLDYTFYVPAGEDIDEAIKSEVLRLVAAQETSAAQYLDLLPGREDRLEALDVTIDRGPGGPAGRAAAHRKALALREKKKTAVAVLESIATPLHLDESLEHPRPMIGRDADKALLASVLGGADRMGVVLVGEGRVGKTALLRAWLADELAAGRARYVYATSGAQLIAGMSGLGQWQERVRRVMEAAHTLDAIVYFDDLADLFSERAHGIDLAGGMKPWLEDGKVRLVGELAADRAELVEHRHVGFFASLSRIRLEPMTAAQALEAVRAHAAHDAKHAPHKVQIDPAALVPLVDLAERYMPYEAFPGKAVRLYEELRGAHELARPKGKDTAPRIGAGEVFDWFSVRTGVPTFLLREDEALKQESILAHFDARLIGQEEAKTRVADTVCMVKAGLQPGGKPLATFLFVGPTGVGKTELARALAELLFGSADRLVRFDMSEYTDPWAAERLIRGTERGEGLLTRQVREQPFSVVLLDEIEKAHPAVFDLLLQVCGEGRLTDGRGKTTYFHNAILIMTSNLGAAHRRALVGFAEGDGPARDDDRAYYTKQVESNFRPEFVNRIDRIVAFRSLSREEVREVVRLAVARVRTRRGLVGAATELLVSDAALARLAHDGYSDVYGARALRRHVEERLVGPIARLLGSGNWDGPRDKIDVRAEEEAPYEGPERVLRNEAIGGLRVVVLSRPRGAARAQARVWDLSEVRREMQRWIRLPKVAELKSHLEFLVAQLSYGQNGKKDRARSADVAQLGAEHARLHHVYDALARGLADVQSAEELGFLAFFAGESVDALLEESKELRARFREALFDALVCRDPRRHGITLVLQELDEGRAFDHWLAPLLGTIEQRGWSCELHVDGEAAEPAARWPKDRRWGPPRDADYVLGKLAEKERAFKNVLFRVRGPNAGILLGLEGGLHRMHGVHESVQPVHMMVTRIAFRTAFQDKEWVPPILNPPPPAETSAAILQLPVRELNAQTDTVEIMKRITLKIPLRQYWARQREIALEQLLLFETIDELDLDAFLTTRFVERWDDVLDLARRGDKIGAIKLYRERTGAGLLDAKNYVEALE